MRTIAETDLGLSHAERERFDGALLEATTRGAADADVTTLDNATTTLRVKVSWANDSQTDYGCQIYVREQHHELASRTFTCERCGTSTLVERVQSEVAALLRKITWPEPEPEPEPEPALPSNVSEPPDHGSKEPAQTQSIGRLGWIGIGVGSVGLLTAGAGAAVWARGDETETRPDPESSTHLLVKKTPYRTVGIAMVGVGAGAAVVGGALLITNIVRRRRARVATSPLLGHGLVGIGLAGRF